jgi:hypothetical protein
MPRRAQVAICGLVMLVSASVALAVGAQGLDVDRIDGAVLAAARSQTPVKITNTKQGHTVISAHRLVPGKSLRRKVRLRNVGFDPARMRLDVRIEPGHPGPNGGDLADALRLRVRAAGLKRRPGPDRPTTIYEGRLSEIDTLRLGRWKPGDGRRFRFHVEFPNHGRPARTTGGDNRYQGSRTGFRLVWRATPSP